MRYSEQFIPDIFEGILREWAEFETNPNVLEPEKVLQPHGLTLDDLLWWGQLGRLGKKLCVIEEYLPVERRIAQPGMCYVFALKDGRYLVKKPLGDGYFTGFIAHSWTELEQKLLGRR